MASRAEMDLLINIPDILGFGSSDHVRELENDDSDRRKTRGISDSTCSHFSAGRNGSGFDEVVPQLEILDVRSVPQVYIDRNRFELIGKEV